MTKMTMRKAMKKKCRGHFRPNCLMLVAIFYIFIYDNFIKQKGKFMFWEVYIFLSIYWFLNIALNHSHLVNLLPSLTGEIP